MAKNYNPYYKRNQSNARVADITPMQDAVKNLLDLYRLKGRFLETHIINLWDEMMGESISKRTQKLFIRDEKLFVSIDSPAVRNELLLAKSQIIEALNKASGEDILKDLVFI